MRRTAAVLALSLVLLAPAPALAQEPSPSSSPIDCSKVTNENGGCMSPSPSPSPSRGMFDPANCANATLAVWPLVPPFDNTTRPSYGWRVSVAGNPDTTVILRAYTRPSTAYQTLGIIQIGADGSGVFRNEDGTEAVKRNGNTRFAIHNGYPDCGPGTDSEVGFVRTDIGSIQAVRNSPRDYTFTGTAQGVTGKIISLYRTPPGGGQITLVAQTRILADGIWRIDRTFTGSGQFDLRARAGNDVNSAAGASASRFTVIH